MTIALSCTCLLHFPGSERLLSMQLCSGVDENATSASAQLVFAPIDESFADDAPLLPSGFRVIPLDTKMV
jgi:homeobox-leucine zipper protein